MGASQSSRTTMEPSPAFENSVGGPPQLRKVESFEEKFYRKVKGDSCLCERRGISCHC
jgi:hypothetical protein